ncbi:MAG: hypothetical protein ABIK75_07025 [candidate division WOR-3 bacterium]
MEKEKKITIEASLVGLETAKALLEDEIQKNKDTAENLEKIHREVFLAIEDLKKLKEMEAI